MELAIRLTDLDYVRLPGVHRNKEMAVSDVIPEELKDRLLNDPSLPVVIPFKNHVNFYINLYKEETDLKDICALMKGVSDEGLGIGSKEYATDDDVKEKLRQGTTFVLRDTCENGNLIALNILVPCSLSRSEHPLYTGSNIAVHEKYRSQGIGEFLIIVLQYIGSGLGLKPVLGRHTITARSNIPARSGGAVYLGIIPKSIRIKKPNVVADDIIVFYGDHWPEKNGQTADRVSPLFVGSFASPTTVCQIITENMNFFTFRQPEMKN